MDAGRRYRFLPNQNKIAKGGLVLRQGVLDTPEGLFPPKTSLDRICSHRRVDNEAELKGVSKAMSIYHVARMAS